MLVTLATRAGADELSERVARMNASIESARVQMLKTGRVSDVAAELEGDAVSLQAAHDVLIAQKREEEASFAMLRSGDCLRMLSSRGSDALDRYKHAIVEASHSGNIPNYANAWLGIEKVSSTQLGDRDAAQDALDRIAGVIEKLTDSPTVQIDFYRERAALAIDRNDNPNARINIEKALKLTEALHRDDKQWLNYYVLSSVDFNLQQSRQDEFAATRANDPRAWKACQLIARDVREKLQQSRQNLESAIRIAETLHYDFFVKKMLAELAPYDTVKEEFEGMYRTKEREQSFLIGPEPVPLVDSAAVSAGGALDESLNDIRKVLENEHHAESMTWRRRFLEGQLEEARNHVSEALAFYRQAADMVEIDRHTLGNEVARRSFDAERAELYGRLVRHLLARRDFEEALLRLEQSRARTTLDVLTGIDVRFPTSGERSLYGEWVAARVQESLVAGKPDDERAHALMRAEELTRAVVARIRARSPQLLKLGVAQPVTLPALQKALAESPCDLVYYLLNDERLILWHIGPSHVDVQALHLPNSKLSGLTHQMMENWNQQGEFDSEAAARLYDYLVRPLISSLETGHLVVIPAPQLESLPFEALFDDVKQEFLGEQMALSYGPSASVIAKLKPGRPLGAPKLLLVVGPQIDGGEAQRIASGYPESKILTGRAASFNNLMAAAKGRVAVHMAVHGIYNPTPMLSTLRFARSDGADDFVTAAQLFALPLNGANLVSLASCSAGKSMSFPTGDADGFIRSLLYAGAQTLVLPLWDVAEGAAAFWYTSFYANARDHGMAEAAHLANIATRREKSFGLSPRLWAAYRVIGR